ncbi:hypothetical protein [Tessaracoccus sp. ZS01]|uniref:hypothetical protein n=1 Tax=Tessaracoccus sp. ZS01 TaxID=1906324 RepID=UPI00096F3DEE|nr:hypothetical protein [Tessaracoccus sp. ZS01]MCG6568298.1 hypothetical protein [Tessaracoccus sp. ZS01]OMG53388.1 hypothetical protein BJN44_11815 [Tessaracoccus sp. ZS01]
MPRTQPPKHSAGSLLWLGAGLAYLSILVPALLGGVGAALVPCGGFLCNVGYAFLGALAGAALGVVVVVFLAARLGLRWWFVPVLLAVAAAGVALFTTFDGVPAGAGVLVAVLAPVAGALTASGLKPRRLLVGAVALLTAIAVGVALLTLGDHLDRRSQLQQRAEKFRTTTLPLVAPTSIEAPELRLVLAEPEQVIYDLRTPEHAGWLRIVLEPTAVRECSEGNVTDLGDDIFASGEGHSFRRVCRELGEVDAELWPDGGDSDWGSDEMVEVARALEPAGAQWFADHQES